MKAIGLLLVMLVIWAAIAPLAYCVGFMMGWVLDLLFFDHGTEVAGLTIPQLIGLGAVISARTGTSTKDE